MVTDALSSNISLIDILVCPTCRRDLQQQPESFRCESCSRVYPVVDGIPRFVNTEEYAGSFGYEWLKHATTQLDDDRSKESEETFRQKTGFTPADLQGNLVLDVGCGMGRFADVVSRWGGRVVGFDLSRAVEAAHKNLGARENVAILQANVFHAPFREGVFDFIYSIGVLDHTPDCEKAFRQLPRLLKPGGRIAIWVYHTSDQWGFTADLYRKITVHLPHRLLHAICRLAIPLYYLDRIPIVRSIAWRAFPHSGHPNPEWRVLDTFDWYSPRYMSRHSREEVESWFRTQGLTEIRHLNPPTSVNGTKPLKRKS